MIKKLIININIEDLYIYHTQQNSRVKLPDKILTYKQQVASCH